VYFVPQFQMLQSGEIERVRKGVIVERLRLLQLPQAAETACSARGSPSACSSHARTDTASAKLQSLGPTSDPTAAVSS
jgi:hypothetical protein